MVMIEQDVNKDRLLMVDDDPVFLQVLSKAMAKRGFDVITATGISDAVARAKAAPPAMAVVDLKLEGESGLDLIPLLIEINPEINIVLSCMNLEIKLKPTSLWFFPF